MNVNINTEHISKDTDNCINIDLTAAIDSDALSIAGSAKSNVSKKLFLSVNKLSETKKKGVATGIGDNVNPPKESKKDVDNDVLMSNANQLASKPNNTSSSADKDTVERN